MPGMRAEPDITIAATNVVKPKDFDRSDVYS